MQGLGYTPVCSSSCLSKTAIFDFYGITAPFFGEGPVTAYRRMFYS